MQFVTLINRSTRILEALWDGKRYDIPPGLNSLPEAVAIAAKRQHPLMGSEDPFSLRIRSLLAIREHGDDESPLEQNDAAIERWNRASVPGLKPSEVVPGRSGLYAHEISSPLPQQSAFVDPEK